MSRRNFEAVVMALMDTVYSVIHVVEYVSIAHILIYILYKYLILKYVTDVVPNLQTVIWFALSESFVHNLALSFAQPGAVC